jgi:predicted nucleic-acid-binding Zn-ribbon protein
MPAETVKVKPKTKISYYEICCKACNLSQFYHGKSHTKCIHCLTPLDLRNLRPKYQ